MTLLAHGGQVLDEERCRAERLPFAQELLLLAHPGGCLEPRAFSTAIQPSCSLLKMSALFHQQQRRR